MSLGRLVAPLALRPRCGWLALGSLLLANAASAGEQVLVNAEGDRLNGHLVRQADGWIEFESTLLGRVRVAASKARVVPACADGAACPPARSDKPAAALEQPVAREPGLGYPAWRVRRPYALAGAWEQTLGLALRMDRGSRETLSDEAEFDYILTRNHGPDHSRIELGYEFDRDEGEVKDDDWKILLRQDRDLGSHYFLAGRFSQRSDLEDGVRERAQALAFVGGWRFGQAEGSELRVGLGHTWAKLADGDAHTGGHGPTLYASWEWRPHADFALSGSTVYAPALDSGRAYYWEYDLRVDWAITAHFGLAWTWDYTRNTYDFNRGDSAKTRWLLTWTP